MKITLGRVQRESAALDQEGQPPHGPSDARHLWGIWRLGVSETGCFLIDATSFFVLQTARLVPALQTSMS